MTARTESIWARMPEDARELVRKSPSAQRERWIEIWDLADRNERAAVARRRSADDSREAYQDELDELLLKYVTAGDYGDQARAAVAECAKRHDPKTGRRAFLRAVRLAVKATRGRRSARQFHGGKT